MNVLGPMKPTGEGKQEEASPNPQTLGSTRVLCSSSQQEREVTSQPPSPCPGNFTVTADLADIERLYEEIRMRPLKRDAGSLHFSVHECIGVNSLMFFWYGCHRIYSTFFHLT